MKTDDNFLESINSNDPTQRELAQIKIEEAIKDGSAVVLRRNSNTNLGLNSVQGETSSERKKLLLLISELPMHKKDKRRKLLKALSGLRWCSRKYLKTESGTKNMNSLRKLIGNTNHLKTLGGRNFHITSEMKKPYRYRLIFVTP